MKNEISSAFPFESKYLEVKGSKMHYIEEGEGDPILFLHGNPTSSYIWRNIIPHLSSQGRCIAPDLIGMGKSDKPDLDYGFFDTYEYLEAFIEKLGLKNITLVIHDWGSGLGFHYAHTHADNIKGIAFMEALFEPFQWANIPAENRIGFRLMRTPGIGWFLVNVLNMFIKQLLPQQIVRKLKPEEMEAYASPYKSLKSRDVILAWPRDVPISGKPAKVHEIIQGYHEWLKESPIPKICFYATPGAVIQEKDAMWIRQNFRNVKMVNVGEGKHFLQEDHPHEIGSVLSNWHKELLVHA